MVVRLCRPLLVLLLAAFAFAQTPDMDPNSSAQQVPTVTFEFVWPAVQPSHYSITVQSSGRAAYRAEPEPKGSGDPYILNWTMSDALRKRIFDLARQAHFFQGDFDYKKGKIANTGVKTLTYSQGPQSAPGLTSTQGSSHQTTYNWSENVAIQQLTEIFQDISATLEFGRKLEHDHRYDRLQLDADLRQMDDLESAGKLLDVHAIAPVLRQVANDFNVIRRARERATRLLQLGGHP